MLAQFVSVLTKVVCCTINQSKASVKACVKPRFNLLPLPFYSKVAKQITENQ